MKVCKGSTDITSYFVLRDSVTHAPKTAVTVTALDLYYVAYQAAISAKADAAALGAANSAHADNSAFEVGLGVYRIDWPDVWTGAVGTTVQLIVVGVGIDTTFLEVEITGLPNIAAGLNGGLLIAGSNAAAVLAALTITGAFTVSDGVIISATTVDRAGFRTTGNGTGPGLVATGGAQGAGLQAIGQGTGQDGILAEGSGTGNGIDAYGGATGAGIWASGGGNNADAHGIQAVAGGVLASDVKGNINGTITRMGYNISGAVTTDAGNSETSFETNLASAVNDYYKDCLLLITSGALIGQVKKVTAYDGATKIITVDGGFTATPADDVTFLLVNQ
jgi:hypothetical protein